ncbi:MAG: GspH/FimT family pseudopilin [Solirubrobacterales bacterium]
MQKTRVQFVRSGRSRRTRDGGFTIVELMIVLVILGVAAAIVVPMAGSAAPLQLRSAANMVAADLEYAKSLSITTGRNYRVSFDTTANTYEILDPNGLAVSHPVTKKDRYLVSFSDDGRLDQVTIQSAVFGATSEVRFDYLGTPYSSSSALTSEGVVTLEAGGATRTVTVSAVTGLVSVH